MTPETLKIALTSVLTAFITAIASIWTSAFGFVNDGRELDIQMIKIGYGILSEAKGDENPSAKYNRKFAILNLLKYLATYSGS